MPVNNCRELSRYSISAEIYLTPTPRTNSYCVGSEFEVRLGPHHPVDLELSQPPKGAHLPLATRTQIIVVTVGFELAVANALKHVPPRLIYGISPSLSGCSAAAPGNTDSLYLPCEIYYKYEHILNLNQ